ncbi:MAG: beta-N-acetylhexosaminidase [Bdellovibrionales bacterium]|nr:beta-N-acetylhexosaminidase [Bdellovibrionales bacterium]
MLDQDYSVSELVIMGFQGKTLRPETLNTISTGRPPLFILFSHNYESKEQLIALTDELQVRVREAGHTLPAIISADQEGGRVQRFRKDFTLLPSAQKVGEKASPNLTFDLTRIQAKELFSAGIQLNYAPVCDINTNPANPVIGDRAYGTTSDIVTRMASAVVRGHLTEGVEPCIKHFPGHGDTHLDSHESLPTVHTPLETLRYREWTPFHRAMKSGANFLMSAHILLPHLDGKNPGTLSPTFLREHLRGTLMYQGIVVSDDMEMGAITSNYGTEEAPVLALQAGCDLLCYRSEEAALVAMESIRKALVESRLDPSLLKGSIDRVRKIRSGIRLARERMSLVERLQNIGSNEHQAFVQSQFS